jgi:hypothetical protein
VASRVGLFVSAQEAQYDLLRRLQDHGILPREIAQLFDEIRRAGNTASHTLTGDHRTALSSLKITWQLSLWFHRSFQDAAFKSGPFIPPKAPQDESAELRHELERLTTILHEYHAQHLPYPVHAGLVTALEARLRRPTVPSKMAMPTPVWPKGLEPVASWPPTSAQNS